MNKDIRNLLLYVLLLCSSFPAVAYMSMSFLYSSTMDTLFQALPPGHNFIENLIYTIPLLCFITLFFLPMAITKIALDKNWSKYLNHFFDNMQYPIIVLVCYIFFKLLLKICDYSNLVIEILNPVIYCSYFVVFLRKFIKPLYKHFWLLYSFCMVIFALLLADSSLHEI